MPRPDEASPVDEAKLALAKPQRDFSAPAGFGKTTLLTEWLASAPAANGPAAWLSLDQSDNEPTLFWAYVIAALQTVNAEVGTRAPRCYIRLSRCLSRRCWGPRSAPSSSALCLCSTTIT